MAMNQDQPFRFSDLPPELRNDICSRLLVAPQQICILLRKKKLYAFSIKVRIGFIFYALEENHEGLVSLLRVSRSVNTEAAPILYASNTFALHKANALTSFARQIQTNARHLRHIELRNFMRVCHLRRLKKSLKPAVMLSSLHIHYGSCPQLDTGEMAHVLWPLFAAWHKAQKAARERQRRNVLDILQITSGWMDLEDYEQNVKALIALTLD